MVTTGVSIRVGSNRLESLKFVGLIILANKMGKANTKLDFTNRFKQKCEGTYIARTISVE